MFHGSWANAILFLVTILPPELSCLSLPIFILLRPATPGELSPGDLFSKTPFLTKVVPSPYLHHQHLDQGDGLVFSSDLEMSLCIMFNHRILRADILNSVLGVCHWWIKLACFCALWVSLVILLHQRKEVLQVKLSTRMSLGTHSMPSNTDGSKSIIQIPHFCLSRVQGR